MPSISSCPTCHRDLTIPDLADRQKALRCPLCDAQFTAEQVLADCVSFPPLAIVVEAAAPPGEVVETEGPQYSPADDVLGATLATTHGELPQDSAGLQASPAAATEAAMSADAAQQDLPVTETPPGGAADQTEAAGTGDHAFEPQISAMRVSPRVRRQTSPLAMLGQLVGMALGGVLGLAIGYWVLLWIGGPQSDFLELRPKLPRWLLPPVRRHDAAVHVPLAKEEQDNRVPERNFIDLAAWPSPTGAAAVQEPTADAGNSMSLQSVPTESAVDEPAPLETNQALRDPSASSPKILPAGYLGPREFKLRTAAELQAAIEQTDLALRCPRCQMPGAVRLVSFESAADSRPGGAALASPCDACRGKPVLHLGTAGFEQLCELGEAVTFVQFGGNDVERERLRDAVETVLMAIGNQRDKRETIGRLSGAWLEQSGRQTNGIVIAGTVEDARPQGDLFAIRIMLMSCGKHIEVVSRQPPEPALSRRDHVVMLGSIVDCPEDNLVGYAGEASQVIWGGLHLKVVQ